MTFLSCYTLLGKVASQLGVLCDLGEKKSDSLDPIGGGREKERGEEEGGEDESSKDDEDEEEKKEEREGKTFFSLTVSIDSGIEPLLW